MDHYLRRVFIAVGVALVTLWFLLAGWLFYDIKNTLISRVMQSTQPEVQISSNELVFVPSSIPGVAFATYQVQTGDTFKSLGEHFNLSEATLRSLNQANDESLPSVGSTLLIPSQDGIFQTLLPGQTLADISRAYGVSMRNILLANQKFGDRDVSAGDILYLPNAPYLDCKDLRWLTLASLETQTGFIKPTTGRFADGFGYRIHPITGKWTFHQGLDLAPGFGARVVAAQSGIVIFAGIKQGYGKVIVLDHGQGLTSWYAHLDEMLVIPHQKVERGQLIGKVGNTGKVTGPHLHFEVRLNGKPQNPFLYLVQ